jgi:hypothetical protein
LSELQNPSTGTADAASSVLLGGDPVREAFMAVEKVRKLRRLYDASHPLRREADVDLIEKFRRALDEHGLLHLDITQAAIEMDGRPVMEGGRDENSIPCRLSKDGVKTITIRPEIDPDELRRFVNVLDVPADSALHFDEDLVTLMWRENFAGLEYFAVDEMGPGEDNAGRVGTASRPDEMERRVEEIAAAILSARPSDLVEGNAGIRVRADREDLLVSERRAAAPDHPSDSDLGFLTVPGETLARLRRESEQDCEATLVDRVLLILFDLLNEGQSEVDTEGLAALFAQFIKSCLERRDLTIVDLILWKVESAAEGPLKALPIALGNELSSRPCLERLRVALRQGFAGGQDVLESLLRRLAPRALAFVAAESCRLTDEESAATCRTIVLDRSAESPEALLALLDGLPPEASGRIMGDALSRCDREEATGLLTTMLLDVRPVVRAAACGAIEEGRITELQPVLIDTLATGKFAGEERMLLLHAVAVLGGPVAVDCLNTNLGPRRTFRSRRAHEERREAILHLADVADANVLTFLRQGTQSKDRRFAEACHDALARGRGSAS